MSFPRYPKYKPSGVGWLGEVPEGWEVKPLRYVCSVRKGKLPSATFPNPTAETDLPYLSMEYLRGEFECVDYVAASKNIVCAEAGDILLLWDGSNAGEFLRAKHGAVSSTIALIEPKNVVQQFLFFACKARERELKDQTIGMGIPHVSGDTLKSFAIPTPVLPEQAAIAEFLDRETRKIDELVAEQRRLMELLKEKHQAVISHAVTKGLNPHAPMKPSGIEWLGEVPEHWRLTRLRHACSHIFLGLTTTVDYVEEGGIPLVRALNISGGVLDLSEAKFISKAQHQGLTKRNRAIRGDVLLSKSGSIGTAAVVNSDVEFSIYESIFALRARPELLTSPYLLQLLRSQACSSQYSASLVGMGVGHLNMSDIVDVWTALPPLDEQEKIAKAIENQRAKFETLTAEAQRAIDLLQERRTALISAAVTGQIDVRQTPKN
jgi:type I restriction enzyme S subunit